MNHLKFVSMVLAAMVAFALIPSSNVQADGLFGGEMCKKLETGVCPRCQCTGHTCKLKAEVVDAEKKCFVVETKTICVPRVVYPWQKKNSNRGGCKSCGGQSCNACVNNGAKVIQVRVLGSKTYECPQCEYTWTAEEGAAGSCNSGQCQTGCCEDDQVCDSIPYHANNTDQPAPAPTVQQVTNVQAPYTDSPRGLMTVDVEKL